MTTIFSHIIDKTIPADIIYEDEDYLAFRDINPRMETHLLIIPKRPIHNFHEATTEKDRDCIKGLLDI